MKTNLLSVVFAIALTACSSVNAESTEFSSDVRHLENFYGVIINTEANIILSQGETASVVVTGDQNQITEVSTAVKNGALIIGGSNIRPVTIYVTVANVNLIEVNGSARVYANEPINSEFLLLKVNGNGSIKMDVRSLSLGMIVKQNGKIVVSGSTDDSFARIYGRGHVYTQHLDSYRYRTEVYNNHSKHTREYTSTEQHAALRLHE